MVSAISVPYDSDSRYYMLWRNPEPWKIGPVYRGRVGQDQSLVAYQKAVKEALEQQDPKLLPGKVDVEFWFWHQRVRYSGLKKEVVKNEIDVTNMQKATEDAIQGVLIGNDKHVVNIFSHKMADSTDATPLVVIRIGPATHEGAWRLPEDISAQVRKGPPEEPESDNQWM